MQETITQQLKQLEKEREISILYACESGSRAWGFPSPDSDYDVRFIYAHPPDWYFSIEERKDVIELPVNDLLDINGWDIRKALQQFRKCSATLYEWLQSPIVYSEVPVFTETLRQLMPMYFAPRAVVFHHLGLVRKMLAEVENEPEIRLKKAFYILRSILSALWVQEKGSVPPMTFTPLQELITDPALASIIREWLELKKVLDEKAKVERPAVFNAFILEAFATCEAYAETAPVNRPDTLPLNELFRRAVTLTYDDRRTETA